MEEYFVLQSSAIQYEGNLLGQPRCRVPGEALWGPGLRKPGSPQAAVEWLKKCPNPMPMDSDIDIRPLYSLEDLARWKEGVTGKEP